jgi:catechol 2,3-dioxygenase-like lactoylglutathione lyase family enzyme
MERGGAPVLSDFPTHTTIAVSDLDRARAFYQQTLGFAPASIDPGGAFYESAGSRFLVYPSSGAGASSGTVMGWSVDDIERTVADLKERGVTFEEYDTPNLKTEGSIAPTGPIRAAWFKDPDGNIMGIVRLREGV